MQLSNVPAKLTLPFAASGVKNTIPVASQIGITAGAASLTDGFPPLTRTPKSAGGLGPSGLDMNGILNELSAPVRWAAAGGGYVYDATFAGDSNVGGYPKGARILRSDALGYWLNKTDNNTTDPESAGAAAAGWVPDNMCSNVAPITMTGSNVTLTPLQYGCPIIVLSGVLTANLNLIFPAIVGEWAVINGCTGAFAVTCKTASGTGKLSTPGNTRLLLGDGTNIVGAHNEVDTPSQFDNDTSIATTAFIQKALGNLSGLSSANASTTLTLAQLGNLFAFYGSTASQTLTLPDASTVAVGYGYSIVNQASVSVTLKGSGSQNIGGNQAGAGQVLANTIILSPGDSITLRSNGGAQWNVFGYTSGLQFPNSLSTNGYQKLPSGLIIQWGANTFGTTATAVTFPIAFPTAAYGVVTVNSTGTASVTVGATSLTTTGFNGIASTGGSAHYWIAIGK